MPEPPRFEREFELPTMAVRARLSPPPPLLFFSFPSFSFLPSSLPYFFFFFFRL
jgi:hypothetical protein